MKHLIILLIALFTITSCRTRTMVVERVTHDTLTHMVQRVDSVYLRDSVTTLVYQKGDTVYMARDRWRDRLKYVEVHDTLYIHKTDSIPVIKETPKENDPKLSWHTILAMLGVGFLIYIIIKLKG